MTVTINGTTGIDKITDGSVAIADLSATGTPSSSTYLRGDNTWASVSSLTGTTNSATPYATALGYQALNSNSSGVDNTAVGYQALKSTTYANNTAVGSQALQATTTAYNNTAIGLAAGYSNTTGGANTFLGKDAGYSNLTASGNTAVGYQAGTNSTGTQNTCVGYLAGNQITSANYCTIIGAYNGWAGNSNMVVISDGQANIRFAYDGNNDAVINSGSVPNANANPPTVNSMSIGGSGWYVSLTGANNYWNHAYAGTAYNLRYRGSGVGSIVVNSGSVAYNTTSDYRLKDNVQPMTGSLAKVAQLKPVTYTWKATGEASEGFIAHELAEVCPLAVSGEKDAVEEDGSIKPQAIDTSFLVALLASAIQEQQAIIQSQAETISALDARLIALETK